MDVKIKLLGLWCEALEIDVSDVDLSDEGILNEIFQSEIDSIAAIKFVVAVEEEFGVEITDELLILEDKSLFDAVYGFVSGKSEPV